MLCVRFRQKVPGRAARGLIEVEPNPLPRYRITGLVVHSDLVLPHLSALADSTAQTPDVRIVLGAVKDAVSDWDAYISQPNRDRDNLFCRPLDDLFLHIQGGTQIIVDRPETMPDSEVTPFLTGLGWGLLCHQRRLTPLHCSAVVQAGSAFAFTGESGAGKSTLLTGFVRRGYEPCCDDLMVISPGDSPRIHEMRIGAKLWDDAVSYFALTPGDELRLRDARRKFHIPHQDTSRDGTRPLGALYILSDGELGSDPAITPIEGSGGWIELFRSVYRVDMLPWARPMGELARQVTALAQSVPMYRFSRPRDFTRFDDGLDVLEEHMGNLPSLQHDLKEDAQ